MYKHHRAPPCQPPHGTIRPSDPRGSTAGDEKRTNPQDISADCYLQKLWVSALGQYQGTHLLLRTYSGGLSEPSPFMPQSGPLLEGGLGSYVNFSLSRLSRLHREGKGVWATGPVGQRAKGQKSLVATS